MPMATAATMAGKKRRTLAATVKRARAMKGMSACVQAKDSLTYSARANQTVRRAKATQPVIEQALFLRPIGVDAAEAERRCVRARKRAEKACAEVGIRVYFPSFSFSTITYKGMCLADKLGDFYLDLVDERYQVPLAIFHQRFSTNTLPTWERIA